MPHTGRNGHSETATPAEPIGEKYWYEADVRHQPGNCYPGLGKITMKTSDPSGNESFMIGTLIVLFVSLGLKVSVPLVSVSSDKGLRTVL